MSAPLLVNAPVLATAAAVEDAGAATMGATTAGAAAPVTAVLPPGGEDASAAAAAGFVAHGAMAEAMLTQLTMIRGLFAQTVAASGASYLAMDAINEASVAI
ncbi:PE domain-containing protein [Mycobacterium intracellulare]|uniref:PE domain-containing protein n=1 Tax=Mycobacterium intracellulare TaxID=1767 RepID=UPI0006CA8A8F|nr:PE domain-containing protein [Mycobacterium intracellulare]KPN47692.1 PE family protein [Mycobacterium intracellulare subsp. chimaera]